MTDEMRKILRDGAASFGVTEQPKIALLERYVSEIELWNPSYKLVGTEGNGLIIKHILDSLSAADILSEHLSGRENPIVADLGSGAGLPGIPLAVALDSVRFDLIDRMSRRIGFLCSTLALLGLNGRVSAKLADLEDVSTQYDALVFRAFRPLPDIAQNLLPLLKDGAAAITYKGNADSIKKELGMIKCLKPSVVPVKVPYLEEDRYIVVLSK